jgi:hypothetical protein
MHWQLCVVEFCYLVDYYKQSQVGVNDWEHGRGLHCHPLNVEKDGLSLKPFFSDLPACDKKKRTTRVDKLLWQVLSLMKLILLQSRFLGCRETRPTKDELL